MPYIKQEARAQFEPELDALCVKIRNRMAVAIHLPTSAMFNYIAFKLLGLLLDSYPEMSAGMAGFNDAVEEFRRRHMNPLEDARRRENGDIY